MAEIALPDAKRIIWQQMRDDLRSLVPWFANNDLLLCPACCRPVAYEDMSIEHILPKQALADDPAEVRAAIAKNERAGLTLLCRKPLYIQQKQVHPLGCNSWKGKFYDPFLRRVIRSSLKDLSQRHQIALLCASYLGAVQKFGYQVALTPSGLLMRKQFFAPNTWRRDMPSSCQMMLAGAEVRDLSDDMRSYWSEPFKFTMHGSLMVVNVRSIGMLLPMSRDPTLPLARALPYAPSKFRFRPDLTSAFD